MTQIFVKYILHLCIFRHLKLEIALAIPASNDEKWNSYTSISRSWHAPRPGSQRVKLYGELQNLYVTVNMQLPLVYRK